MATWEEICTHLRTSYSLVVVESGWLGMEWTFTHQGAVLRQRVKIERSTSYASDWVLVMAAVCRSDALDAAGALRFNARLAIGSLAIEGATCYLRAALPADTLVVRDLDRTIELVARETARLRVPSRLDAGTATLFTHYED
jgi:hypothetical protein